MLSLHSRQLIGLMIESGLTQLLNFRAISLDCRDYELHLANKRCSSRNVTKIFITTCPQEHKSQQFRTTNHMKKRHFLGDIGAETTVLSSNTSLLFLVIFVILIIIKCRPLPILRTDLTPKLETGRNLSKYTSQPRRGS
jgi:hypothetical protein